jgi:putative cardiolipin synthase
MKSTFFMLLILVFLSSCSTNTSFTSIERLPAEANDCLGIANTILHKPKYEYAGKKSVIDLRDVIRKRVELNQRYESITESIKDFELHADIPTNGKTKLLLDPREGFLAKIMMIRNAKKTLDLSYYIFRNEDTGKSLLHEVRLAIKRGVKVRILVDSSGSISKAPFYDDIKALVALSGRPILDAEGAPTGEKAFAEAVLFNPVFNIRAHVSNWFKRIRNLFAEDGKEVPLATFTINRRSHDKILLVDAQSETDSMAIIGGRNIADHYYAVNDGVEHPVLDAEILIKGFAQKNNNDDVQNHLENHYNKIFYYLANKNFENFLFKTNRKIVRNEFKEMRESAKRLYLDEAAPLAKQLEQMEKSNFLEEGFEDGLVSVLNEIQNLSRTKIFLQPKGLHNKPNGNSFVGKLHEMISKAEKTIDIASPYFWIPDEEVEYILEWLEKDPDRKIRIFSNSLTTSDNVIAQAMVDETLKTKILNRIKDTPLEKQFELYAYGKIDDKALGGNEKYGFLHAKLALVDGKSMTVSTSNLDPISRHLNSEIGVAVENLPADSANIAALKNYFENLASKSSLYGSTEWLEIRNHRSNKVTLILETFVTKIIFGLNLVPLI